MPTLIAGRYRVAESLGQGGMGQVWHARDEILERDVAIKEIIIADGSGAETLHRRTLREARAAARLSHPNVVQVFDVLESDGRARIVMEYVPSRSLHEVLRDDGPIDPRRAARIGLAVLAALRAAHRAGVDHRDVKPANVLLADDGRVLLTDFGIATIEGDSVSSSGDLVVGSPEYMSPERAKYGTAGLASDLWSLGATLYAAVEGHSPFHRGSAIATLTALAAEEPDPPRQAGVLGPVLAGLLRKDPAERIGAEETEDLLREASAGAYGRATPVSPPVPVPAPRRPSPAEVAPPPAEVAPPPAEVAPPPAEAAALPPAEPAESALAEPASTEPEPSEPAPTEPELSRPAPTEPELSRPAPTEPELSEPVPAAGGPAAGRGRPGRRVVTAAAAVLAVVLALTVWLVAGRGTDPPGGDRAAPTGSPAPSASVPSTTAGGPGATAGPGAAAGPGATAVPGATGGSGATPGPGATAGAGATLATGAPAAADDGARPPLPAGWTDYRDPTGFSVYVPAGWSRSREGSIVYFRSRGRVLGIDQTNRPQPDPVADWRGKADYRSARGDFPSYREVHIRPVDYWREAADWEFTFSRGGVRQHVNNRGFVTANDQAYGIWWQTTDAAWAGARDDLQLIFDSFRPAP